MNLGISPDNNIPKAVCEDPSDRTYYLIYYPPKHGGFLRIEKHGSRCDVAGPELKIYYSVRGIEFAGKLERPILNIYVGKSVQ